jgi:hypothetical protein
MLLKTLINPKPKIIVYFVVFSVIFLCLPLIRNNSLDINNHLGYSPWLFYILSIIIVPLHAFGLNNLIYKNNIVKKENLIIATIFILLNTFNIDVVTNLISSFLMLFFINYLFESYQKEYPFNEIFCASLILAIIVFLNPIMLVMYLLVLTSSLVFNYINWRSLVISILGFCIPYILCVFYLFIMTNELDITSIISLPEFAYNEQVLLAIAKEKIFSFSFLILILITFFEFFSWLYKKSIRSRKSFFIILIYFLIALIILFFGSINNWYLIISPLSVFIANYLTYARNRNLANILFYIFIISSCYYRCMIII